jgi:hypothetical protein
MKFEKILPDYEKSIEVYSNESEEMLDETFASTIKIKSLKQIGSGGQATVFKSTLTTSREKLTLVDKLYKVFNNKQMANNKFREMYKEFRIGCYLKHSGIVEYKYFIRMNSPKLGSNE